MGDKIWAGSRIRWVMLFYSTLLFLIQPSPADSQPQETKKVRIGYSALSLAFLPHLLAKDAGIFDKHGLAVELIQMAGPIQVAALSSQDVDFGAAVAPALFAAVRGLPLKGVMIAMKTPLFYIVVEPTLKKLDDVAGKKMAVDSVGGLQQIAARMMLKKNGVNPDQVSYIQTGSVSNSVAALNSGAVNAALLSIPNNLIMTNKGFLQLASTVEAQVNYPPSGLMIHANKLQRDSILIRRMAGAMLDALRSIEKDRAAVTGFIQRRWKLDPKLAEESYQFIVPTLAPNGRMSLEEVQGFLDIAFENNQLSQKANSRSIVDYSVLDELLRDRRGK
jgi:ABC-type nitrate/sulfonate/bicarbonate transport system substrate-binding protein